MKIITAIENKKINEQLKNINNIKILNSDIQYKEGVLEYLEKNNNLDLIILKENLPGQINLLYLINEIKKINNKIKIIILLNNNYFEKYEKIKNVEYVFLEKININSILKLLNIEKNIINKKTYNTKIINVTGNNGAGKTTITAILLKILVKEKNKILLIDEDENKILTKIFFKNNYKKINNELIKLNNYIYFLNYNYLINNKINIFNYIKKIKNKFNIILIDNKNNKFNNYDTIATKNLYLLEANMFELEKAKKQIKYNNIELIINKYNINSIDKNIIEKILNKKILLNINYNKNINLFINKNLNLNYINKKIILKIIKIIN